MTGWKSENNSNTRLPDFVKLIKQYNWWQSNEQNFVVNKLRKYIIGILLYCHNILSVTFVQMKKIDIEF